MFTNNITLDSGKAIRSAQHFVAQVANGARLKRVSEIPDQYWDLIQRCWKQNPDERPTFEEIVEILKDDKYAFEEFGMKTNMDELHEYQKRIDPDE